jgi:hypothetical protein
MNENIPNPPLAGNQTCERRSPGMDFSTHTGADFTVSHIMIDKRMKFINSAAIKKRVLAEMFLNFPADRPLKGINDGSGIFRSQPF